MAFFFRTAHNLLMDLQGYLQRRQQQSEQSPRYRNLCVTCMQPEFGCYCADILRVDAKMTFVILIHPIEVRRRIATGRMSSLCLQNSHLISGQDFSLNDQVNALIDDPKNHCVMLYPGLRSKNLSLMNEAERFDHFTTDKNLTIFVIDGTWATAKKMVRQSTNLAGLDKICFSPEKPSNFRVRKQPHPLYYSTIEAIHQTIELIGESQGFETKSRLHDNLLKVFDGMVERQLECTRRVAENPELATYRPVPRKAAFRSSQT